MNLNVNCATCGHYHELRSACAVMTQAQITAAVVGNWPGSQNSFFTVNVKSDGPFYGAMELTIEQADAVFYGVGEISGATTGIAFAFNSAENNETTEDATSNWSRAA